MPATSAEECQIVLLSPYDIHFSQTRIRTEFQDSRLTEDAIAEIKMVPLGDRSCGSTAKAVSEPPAPDKSASAESNENDTAPEAEEGAAETPAITPAVNRDEEEYGLGEGWEDYSAHKRGKDFQMLWHPFPRIEVTKWRCKLREPDGSPKLDPVTGLELYSHEERWFSFDNRRLFCLQKAAVTHWPTEVRVEVVEIPQNMARMRELRKFDTRTFGCTVVAGRRDDPNPETWSWRAAVGLPEEAQPEEGVARQKSMRWRGQRRGSGPNSGTGRRRRDDNEGEEEGHGMELMRSALLFFLVYLGLRVIVSVFRHKFQQGGASPEAPAVSPVSGLDGGL